MTRRKQTSAKSGAVPIDDAQIQALCAQIANAKPGEKLVYYTGNLARDAEDNKHVCAIRKVIWQAMTTGGFSLTQRLVSRNQCRAVYDYIAIKRGADGARRGLGIRVELK